MVRQLFLNGAIYDRYFDVSTLDEKVGDGMLTYWLMFFIPAWASVSAPSKSRAAGKRLEFSWFVAGLFLTVLVGLRHKVGGDWSNYEAIYLDIAGAPLSELLDMGDPGYYLLNWLSSQVEGGTYLVNLMAGLIFSVGVVAFCRQQPRPWLALAVAVPYMIIVVGMGYSRQAIALGLALLGLVGIAKQSNLQFVLCVALAATFHKSAVLLVPIAVLASPGSRLWTGLWVGIATITLYYLLLADSVDNLVTNYLDAGYQSEGAAVRIAMNALPATILLLFRKKFVWQPAERNLWISMSVLAIGSVAWLLVSSSSTAVDRVALYLIPLQLFVFARLPDVLGRGSSVRMWVIAVVAYYAAVLLVWLNFATHAFAWVPYDSWFFL